MKSAFGATNIIIIITVCQNFKKHLNLKYGYDIIDEIQNLLNEQLKKVFKKELFYVWHGI